MNRLLCALVGCGLAAPVLTASVWQPPGTISEESQVRPYSLPDPLVMTDGTRVTDGAGWRTRRRPELLRQFESVVYGSTPGPGPAAVASSLRVDRAALGGAAIRTEVTLRLSSASPEPAIHVLLYTPANARGRVPVVVGLNFDGNQAVAKDPESRWPRRGCPPAPPASSTTARPTRHAASRPRAGRSRC